MAVAVLPQLGTRQLMATDGNPWVAAMGEQLVKRQWSWCWYVAVVWEWAGLYYWGMSSCRYHNV